MPLEKGDYRELLAYKQVIELGILKHLPNYAIRLLWYLINHANFPSGWVWAGKTRAESKVGLDWKYWLKGHLVLDRFGLYEAWGKVKTKGGEVLAVKLRLGLTDDLLNTLPKYPPDNWDVITSQLKSLRLGCLDMLTGMFLCPNWDYIKIKESTTLKNPKEPRDSISQDTKSKDSLLRGLCDEFKEFEVSLRSDWDFYVDKSKQSPDEVYSKLKKKALEGSYKPAD